MIMSLIRQGNIWLYEVRVRHVLTRYLYLCRNSCFFGTSLEETLRERGVDHVILAGVGTDVCVETTARDAYQFNFAVTTTSDATGACNESDHRAALHALRNFGGTASTSEVMEALEKLRNSNHIC